MSHDDSQDVHIKIDCGPRHNVELNTTIPKGTEVAYFTGVFYGAAAGGAKASSFLVDLLFPDGNVPDELKTQAAAGKATKEILG